jgi:hypothetical protein
MLLVLTADLCFLAQAAATPQVWRTIQRPGSRRGAPANAFYNLYMGFPIVVCAKEGFFAAKMEAVR